MRYVYIFLLLALGFNSATAQLDNMSCDDMHFKISGNVVAYQPVDGDGINGYSKSATNTSMFLEVKYLHWVLDDAFLGMGVRYGEILTDLFSSEKEVRLEESWLELPILFYWNSSKGERKIRGDFGVGFYYSGLLQQNSYSKPNLTNPEGLKKTYDAFSYNKLGICVDYSLSLPIGTSWDAVFGLYLGVDILTMGMKDDFNNDVMQRNISVYFGALF